MSKQLMTPAEIERATVERCASLADSLYAEAMADEIALAIRDLPPMFGDVPAGWQLVPVEPTRAMLDAAHVNFRKDIEIDPLLKTSYRAMIAAAPNAGQAAAKDAEPVEKEADGWIKWEGGDCPVPEGTLVDVRYRDGQEQFNLPADEINPGKRDASCAFWINDAQDNDIIAYRVISAAPEAK